LTTNKKNVIENLKFSIEKISNLRFVKDVEIGIKMYISNFANIAGISIRSTIEFASNVVLKMNKKFNILSALEMNSILIFALKSIISIDSKIDFNSTLSLKTSKKLNISSSAEFLVGTDRILRDIDSLLLDELDLLTLEEVGFIEGIIFVLSKKIPIDSDVEFNTILDFLGYYYEKLQDHDSKLLGDMDSLTLEELDRSLI
jgi:hypothetical protein